MIVRQSNFRVSLIAAMSCAVVATALFGCNSRVSLGPVADAHSVADIRTAFGGAEQAAAAGSGGAAPAAIGTGWATIKGHFVFDGTPPKMSPYGVTKDQATCAPGGKIPLQETLLIDGSGGIKNIAVYLREASRVNDSAQPKGGEVVFDQKSCMFLSHVIGATVGQTLDIKNSDDVGHNTNIVGKNQFNQIIPAGKSVPLKLQKEEATPAAVTCSIHPWMSAYLLPRANGYFAVTAADGSFEIQNVPAGEKLDFQVWHESAAGAGGALVITTPEAKALEWSNKGRFSVTLQPDEVKEIKVTVPASAFRG